MKNLTDSFIATHPSFLSLLRDVLSRIEHDHKNEMAAHEFSVWCADQVVQGYPESAAYMAARTRDRTKFSDDENWPEAWIARSIYNCEGGVFKNAAYAGSSMAWIAAHNEQYAGREKEPAFSKKKIEIVRKLQSLVCGI